MGDSEDDGPEDARQAQRAPYLAVVYFHGIGNQRRYEETSRLIDRLDQYLQSEHQRGNSLGMLSKIKPRVEPLRRGAVDIIGYIRTYFSRFREPDTGQSVRFYEVYWAPVMAEQKSPWAVLKWLFRQPLRPWQTRRAPWRERQRLRRATLAAMFEPGRRLPRGTEKQDYGTLLRAYNDFEGFAALRDYPEGYFEQFLMFVDGRLSGKPETAKRCAAVARAWRRTYQREELRNAGLLSTLILLILLLGAGSLLGVFIALQWLLGFRPLGGLLTQFQIAADWRTAATIAVFLAGFVGLGRFLTDYVGDVEAWATYEETDVKYMARNKVLDQSLDVLTHVLTDPACERVTIVAHSLGTSIAHDAMLALTRRNLASNPEDAFRGAVPLEKIEHFVTMGSPIDKIEYLFESYTSTSHRYKRVVESLRGDIGTPPFSRNRKPHVHWINFWDQGDPISGPLSSPANATGSAQRVDNVHVASFGFPLPASSHGGYFSNRIVLKALFEVIYQGAGSFVHLPQAGPNLPPDYEGAYLGPGEPLGTRDVFLRLAVLAPWLVTADIAATLLGFGTLAEGCAIATIVLVGVLLAGYIASRVNGQRNRL